MVDDPRDSELDRWLDTFQSVGPTSDQMRRWAAVAPSKRPTQRRPYREIAAALALGFVLGFGVLSLNNRRPGREPAGNFDPTATVEVIFDKSPVR